MNTKITTCAACKYEMLPSGCKPCCYCIGNSEWEQRDETGQERIKPEALDITSTNQLKDGHLVETARAVVKQITRLDYAIEGVRSKIASIGIRLTDKDMTRDEIGFLAGQLNALQVDLFELEEEREKKLRGAADGREKNSSS